MRQPKKRRIQTAEEKVRVQLEQAKKKLFDLVREDPRFTHLTDEALHQFMKYNAKQIFWREAYGKDRKPYTEEE